MLENLGNLDVTKTGGKVTKIDPATLPGFIPAKKGADLSNIRMRYHRLDLQDPTDVIELERITTKAIRGQGIYIVSKERFVFMDKMFILLEYMEETE